MTALLAARSVSLGRRLQPTDLEIEVGEFVALIGPNGSGKTSLLRALAAIELDAGTVHVAGEDMHDAPPNRRPSLATFLPASREMAWPISSRDVVALGLVRPDADRITELLELLELKDLADRAVDRLSTGERARILLARALAPRPKLLLLDEPLSNLDPYWVLRILDILREAVAGGASAVVSLHDIDRMPSFGRVLLMSHGRIMADLPPATMIESAKLADAFRIERVSKGWRLRSG